MLEIRLLGELGLRLDGRALPPLRSARAESLLAYLLLHRDAPQPRQRIAFLLWPDSSEQQARTNLRHVLHTLRRALPDADRFLELTPRTLQWRADAPCRLDVALFEDALARGALEEALVAYGGELMTGAYDDWLLAERERLAQLHARALERLARRRAAEGRHAEAIAFAERLVREDPLREESHRLLMSLHAARGDRARALRVYHACAATLERELHLSPSGATRAAYEALLPDGEASPPVSRAALVGRDAELARLEQLLEGGERGRAQLVLVSGEAGIGKTRLLEELSSAAGRRGWVTAEARCYAAEGALAYAPVAAWLRALGHARLPDREHRHELVEATAEALVTVPAPLLLVADDVQWADRDTLQFVHYLLRSRPAARLLIAATARLEDIDRAHPLSALLTALRLQERVVEIELARLGRDETAALATALGAPQPPGRLFEVTEGSPLFVVETVRAGAPMTPRVRALLAARLAALSPGARELLGVAATVGRGFTAEVVAAAAGADEQALVRGLDELWRRGIVRAHGAEDYDFSHGLLRDQALEELSPAVRRRNHRRVAEALERLAPDLEAVSAQLAMHHEQAGAAEIAAGWYERAATAAQRMHASADAVRLLRRAIDLTRDPARELDLLSALPAPLLALEGYQSERTIEAHERALTLARRLGREPAAPLLRSIALTRLARHDVAGTREIAGELQARSDRDGEPMLAVESRYLLGVADFWSGALAPSLAHLEAAVALARPQSRGAHLIRYGQDPEVVCSIRLAYALWFVGRGEDAARAREKALALAARVDHPYTTAVSFLFAALLELERGDLALLRSYVGRLGDLRGPQVEMTAQALGGYLDVRAGRRSGLQRVRRAVGSVAVAPAPAAELIAARVLVATLVAAGDVAGCLAASDAALRAARGLHVYDPELRRLRAESLRALGRDDEAAAELERALAVAREQGSRALEERVVASGRNARGTTALASSLPK